MIEAGVHIVHVLFVQPVFYQTQPLAEALEVDDFAGTKETDGVRNVRIIAHSKNIVIGKACFLLCCDGAGTTSPPGEASVSRASGVNDLP